ncbi:SCO family protein [Permianibacter sp. IMCC34836]|uniref:SCO family protein n=1 Tax=Permianibacter fluminis TaxID=2738515 RepID=UPI0015522F84|nr:SCO family protein [Permianibacter fluminis]NQD37903.1 SCO family protein [Permianibacter fluminis]
MKLRTLALASLLVCGIASGATAATTSAAASSGALPTDSLYHSETHWQDMNNQSVLLPTLQGKVQLVAFVYTHCVSMCPVIVADLQRVEAMLTDTERQQVHFTLISLDPERDLPETMLAFMQTHKLDTEHWQFMRGNDDDTRELAMLFNIRYRQEGEEIVHSNTISVLDGSGRLIHQRLGAGGLDAVMTAIRQQLRH